MNKKEWIEIKITCRNEAAESLSNYCFEMGSCGIIEQEDSIQVFFPRTDTVNDLIAQINQYIQNLRDLGYKIADPVYSNIEQKNWNSAWKDFFKPVKVSKSIVVKPPWEKWKGPEPVVIDIYPRMAFGTGTHETTKLCLKFLEEIIEPKCEVLDIGCGSGILSIAAIKSGAKSAFGIDIDQQAIENSIENASLNRAEEYVDFKTGSITQIPVKKYDIILANILTHKLKKIVPHLSSFCDIKTKIVFAGILIEEGDSFISFCKEYGIEIINQKTDGEWLALLACYNKA